MTLGDLDRRILWVRAGGRCTLCKRYLLEGELTTVEVPLGEGAHIVGAADSEKSPRGKNPLPVSDRDTVDNVMLACSTCHNEADQFKVADLLDVTFLLERKREHEADIRLQTGLLRHRRTAVLRMAGNIRGTVVELPRRAAADAVIRGSQRFPFFLQSYDRHGIEIDLQQLTGEHPLDDDYYRRAVAAIDTIIDNQVMPGIRNGDITHISVFAIARLPLLIHLGPRLDDGSPADVYQRHRATDSWSWPEIDDPGTEFDVVAAADDPDAAAGVLITNLSGTAAPAGACSMPCLVDSSLPEDRATESHNDWTTTAGSPHRASVAAINCASARSATGAWRSMMGLAGRLGSEVDPTCAMRAISQGVSNVSRRSRSCHHGRSSWGRHGRGRRVLWPRMAEPQRWPACLISLHRSSIADCQSPHEELGIPLVLDRWSS